ncbi:MAG TPA: sigma-70 family RNA polymerase sigma factor [Frankiaceae bacterium]|nr:sigma-70 family RNA polymerase sigma factor [Frankiaceae bacterium]
MAHDVAFDELYARYRARLRRFAIAAYGRADADDIVQEAMLRAYASFARYDRERDAWGWLTAIVRNVARDRAARPHPVPVPDVGGASADACADVAERHLVRTALGRLSESDRDVLVLRECEDLTFLELSALFGRSENTLRQQVFRARRRLAAAYTALGGRACGVLWWLRRWPEPVAAAVVAGAVLAQAPAPPAAPAVRQEVAAGPAVRRSSAPAGPAAGRAAPGRPLQPARAARLVAPRADDVRPAATPAPHEREPRPGDSPVEAEAGYGPVEKAYRAEYEDGQSGVCALTAVC